MQKFSKLPTVAKGTRRIWLFCLVSTRRKFSWAVQVCSPLKSISSCVWDNWQLFCHTQGHHTVLSFPDIKNGKPSHFVNSHFVNSHFINIDEMEIDKVGSWPNGNWRSGSVHIPKSDKMKGTLTLLLFVYIAWWKDCQLYLYLGLGLTLTKTGPFFQLCS